MSDTREAFLGTVRQAVQVGNRPGTSAEIPHRGHIGYQGAGGDAALCFCEQFRAAGGQARSSSLASGRIHTQAPGTLLV